VFFANGPEPDSRANFRKALGLAAVLIAASVAGAAAQQPASVPVSTASTAARSGTAGVPVLPAGYVIGANDLLSIVFWRDKDMSADVVVRPDGKVSLPLLNDVVAAGLTPEQLRVQLVQAAGKYVTDPVPSVVVKEIRSRNVFITGRVAKPGAYSLTDQMTVLQLIAVAGGLQEYADSKSITVMRNDNGRQRSFKVNYKDVIRQLRVEQNIPLLPGDTVIVP
jgi:polysaccharide export outer membrane protein